MSPDNLNESQNDDDFNASNHDLVLELNRYLDLLWGLEQKPQITDTPPVPLTNCSDLNFQKMERFEQHETLMREDFLRGSF
ncbi:MAG TPA: hypothetical protein VMM56_03715 [Planctomycetaceae bacterium]|nr:hypothetical protein [Planctomycetaceae bacterium]